MFSKAIKIAIITVTLFIPLAAFSYDISCKDNKGKLVFTFNFEKPLSSQISNKLGMKTAVLKGLNTNGDRYSFIANSASEENTDEKRSLILNGFGQITNKSSTEKQNLTSIKNITLQFQKLDSNLNMGSIQFVSFSISQNEEKKLEYLNCHFDSGNTKDIKIYTKILDIFKLKR